MTLLAMRTTSYSFDTQGFLFVCKVVLALFVVVFVVRAGGGLVFGESFGKFAQGRALAEDVASESLIGGVLARLAEGARSGETSVTTEQMRAHAIAEHVPARGVFVGVDLATELLTVYRDGLVVQTIEIKHRPQEGTPDSIPTGLYSVTELEREHFSQIAKVYLPDRIKFEDRFSIHGPPKSATGALGEDIAHGRSIELGAEDAARLFDLMDEGTPIFVLAGTPLTMRGTLTELALKKGSLPALSARSFALADAITGEVYLEHNADKRYPIASITKLMTALVAHGTYPVNEEIRAPGGDRYVIGDLYYPLLLRSDNAVAHALAAHGGTPVFLARMNTQARAIGMYQTSFSDSSGLSARNTSTAHDLSVLGRYLYHQKRFLLDISSADRMTITGSQGTVWNMVNQNKLAPEAQFIGGKLGYTDAAGQTSLALFTVPIKDEVRVVTVVILNSRDWKQDTRTLLRWFAEQAEPVGR